MDSRKKDKILTGHGKVGLIRRFWKPEIAGSNPAVQTNLTKNYRCNGHCVVPWAARVGSIPTAATNLEFSLRQAIWWIQVARPALGRKGSNPYRKSSGGASGSIP